MASIVSVSTPHRYLFVAQQVVYTKRLREEVLRDHDDRPVVIEVCGGSGVSLDLLIQWKEQFKV